MVRPAKKRKRSTSVLSLRILVVVESPTNFLICVLIEFALIPKIVLSQLLAPIIRVVEIIRGLPIIITSLLLSSAILLRSVTPVIVCDYPMLPLTMFLSIELGLPQTIACVIGASSIELNQTLVIALMICYL